MSSVMEKYSLFAWFFYFWTIALTKQYSDKPELFQIYLNGTQLNVLDDTLGLIHGTRANLTCSYRNTSRGQWKIGPIDVYTTSSEWIAGDSAIYIKNSISTKSLQIKHAGDISCIAMGHRRNLTVDVLYPPETATIVGPDAVAMDDHLELTCSANANPVPSFAWTDNGLNIGNASTVSVSREDNTMTFVCNVQNKMVPTFGDAVFSPIRTVRKTIKIEVPGNGDLIAAAIIGWTVAVLVSTLTIVKYLRERKVITKLQNELALARYKKTELSKPLIRSGMDLVKESSDEYRTSTKETPKAPQTVQLSKILESNDPEVTLSPPEPPVRPVETLPAETKPQPQYLDLESQEKDGRVESGADYIYEDVEKRPVEQRYDDLDESAMDNTRQTDGYEQPIELSRTMDSAVAKIM